MFDRNLYRFRRGMRLRLKPPTGNPLPSLESHFLPKTAFCLRETLVLQLNRIYYIRLLLIGAELGGTDEAFNALIGVAREQLKRP